MKTLMISNSGMQATMTVDFLKSNGVDAFSRGSREYASIVTGGDLGRYEILVPEEQFPQAEKLLRQLQLQIVEHDHEQEEELQNSSLTPIEEANRFLKYSILFAMAGFAFFPFINVVSFYYLYKYLRTNLSLNKRMIVSILMLLLNSIPMAFTTYWLWPKLFKGIFW